MGKVFVWMCGARDIFTERGQPFSPRHVFHLVMSCLPVFLSWDCQIMYCPLGFGATSRDRAQHLTGSENTSGLLFGSSDFAAMAHC